MDTKLMEMLPFW